MVRLSVDHYIEIFDRCDTLTLLNASLACKKFEDIIFGNIRICRRFKVVLDPAKTKDLQLPLFPANIVVLKRSTRPYRQLRIKNLNFWMTTYKQKELSGILTKLGQTITKVAFEKCEFKGQHLEYALEMMPLIEILSFESCFFKPNYYPTQGMGKSLTKLEDLKIYDSSGCFLMYVSTNNLISLHLQASEREDCLDDLLTKQKKLKSLTLQTCFHVFNKNLGKVSFRLKSLVIENSHIINEEQFLNFIKSQDQLENVEFEIDNSSSQDIDTFNFGNLMMQKFDNEAAAKKKFLKRMEAKPSVQLSHNGSLQYFTDLKSLKSLKLTFSDYKWANSLTNTPNNKLVSLALHVSLPMATSHCPQTDYISKFSGKLSKIKKLELELPEALDNMDLANLNETWQSVTHMIVRRAANADFLGYLNLPKLRNFTIASSDKLSLCGWKQFARKHPKISHLAILGGNHVNDELIEFLLVNLPLRSLQLDSCDSFEFKDSTVAIIANNRGILKELILKCPDTKLSSDSKQKLQDMIHKGLTFRRSRFIPIKVNFQGFRFF